MFEKRFGDALPGIADVTAGLGAVEWHLGRTAEALDWALRSERISEPYTGEGPAPNSLCGVTRL